MKTVEISRRQCWLSRPPMVALILMAASIQQASAVLINDTFTAPNNTPLVGRLPSPDNEPGASYAGNGNVSLVGGPTGGTPYQADIQSNTARLGADAGVALDLGINTATRFQLSISFNISGNSQTQANDPHRGAGLGFFSSVVMGSGGSFNGFDNFTGLVVDRAGSVRLIIGGANSGIATTVPGFNPAVTHTLSFVVDTAPGVGTISSILLDSTSVALTAPIDTFTLARTELGGFYNSSGAGSDVATFDNLSIAIVPEPNTFIAVAGFTLLVVAGQWFRQRQGGRGSWPFGSA